MCRHQGCTKRFSRGDSLAGHQRLNDSSRSFAGVQDKGRQGFFRLSGPGSTQEHPHRNKFTCPYEGCGKRLARSSLAEHLAVHTGFKPFVCRHEGCSYRSVASGNLRKHQRVHTGIKPFVCPDEACGRRFADRRSQKWHRCRSGAVVAGELWLWRQGTAQGHSRSGADAVCRGSRRQAYGQAQAQASVLHTAPFFR